MRHREPGEDDFVGLDVDCQVSGSADAVLSVAGSTGEIRIAMPAGPPAVPKTLSEMLPKVDLFVINDENRGTWTSHLKHYLHG